ncbi:MAG: metal ABC transporter solute-binding protein, Zn/Mn family [Aggregatilineales bacterium]
MTLRRIFVALLVCLLFASLSAVSAQNTPLRVVATYSVLGDIVQAVAGDQVELTVLVGLDGDPHVYEPTPEDIIALAEADILFENGLELEPWIDDLYEASGSTAVRIAVSDGVDALEFAGHGHDHMQAHGEDGHGGFMEGAPMIGSRLIVGDYESGRVQIVDLRSNQVIADFDLTARAFLYRSPSGRYAFAIQTDGNIANVIDSGVSAVAHDDHFHTNFGSPALLGVEIAGKTPIHYTPHHDQIAIFHDGDGATTVFTEAGLFAGETITVTTARPHHGVAVPLGDVVLISAPNMEDANSALPIGVDVMTLDGQIVQSFHECPGLHGEAAYSDDGVAFGCADGILLVERDGDAFVSRKVAKPTDNPDLRTGTLYYTPGAPYLLGNYGRNAIVRVDVAAGTSEIVIDAGQRIWRFDFHGEDPTKLVALTIDGNLHVIDIASGEIEGTVQVVDPFLPPAQGRAAARPTFVVNGRMAYVSEPLPGDIRAVNLETLEIAEERIFVGGKPSSMAVFGMTTEEELYGKHDHEHDHEGEAHSHSHAHGEFDPHTWMSPLNAMVMTKNIRDALAAADPANAAAYETNAAAYLAELEALDAYIRQQVATIPEANRVLVTTHELFGYFARDYGFTLLDSALGSVTTGAEPSAGQIALVIEEIRQAGVPAIFVENVGNPALMQQIAAEASVALAPPLYTHGLGPAGSGAETYLSMMRYNIDIIAEALR